MAEGRYPAAREAALQRYFAERERRGRYARVRNQRDRERRTLLGAHVPQELAYVAGKCATAEGLSMTAYVRKAVERAMQETAVGLDKGPLLEEADPEDWAGLWEW